MGGEFQTSSRQQVKNEQKGQTEQNTDKKWRTRGGCSEFYRVSKIRKRQNDSNDEAKTCSGSIVGETNDADNCAINKSFNS